MSKGYEMSKGYDMSKQYMSKPYDWSAGAGMMYTPAQSVAMSPSGVMLSGASQQQGISVNTGYPYGQQGVYVSQAPGMSPGMMSVGLQNSSYPNNMQSVQMCAAPMPQYQLYGVTQQMPPTGMAGAGYNQMSYAQQKYLDKDYKYADVHMMSAANSSGMHHVGNQLACMRVKNSPHGAMYTYTNPGMAMAYQSVNNTNDMSGTHFG